MPDSDGIKQFPPSTTALERSFPAFKFGADVHQAGVVFAPVSIGAMDFSGDLKGCLYHRAFSAKTIFITRQFSSRGNSPLAFFARRSVHA
ncbi:hypothetical protein [uncultured Kiloniella sp.]|uniref:hypothetical protein n=1 Tax=uncultured Kiloniella sp. TaxID=1133091 RepID=UPI002627DC25|nr:hypothetical protein [uncultured Kiloniella sp.]